MTTAPAPSPKNSTSCRSTSNSGESPDSRRSQPSHTYGSNDFTRSVLALNRYDLGNINHQGNTMNNRTVAALALAVLLALGACSSDAEGVPVVTPSPSASQSASPTTDESAAPAEEPAAEAPTTGTREAPLAIGETRKFSEGSMWTIGLVASNLDAASAIRAEDEYAPQPAEGERFVVATLQVTADAAAGAAQGLDITSEGADPRSNVSVVFVAADGTSYETAGGSFCYTANDFNSVAGAVYQDGATVKGDFCIAVPAEKVDGGVWRVANYVNESIWISAT